MNSSADGSVLPGRSGFPVNDTAAFDDGVSPAWNESAALPLPPSMYRLIAVLLMLICGLSLIGNVFLCGSVVSMGAYRSPCFNSYILAISLCSLIETICCFPLVVASSLEMRWLFGDTGCKYYAFLTYTCVLFTMTCYVLVTVHRYRVVVLRVPSDSPETYRWVRRSISAAWTYALCWSVCPFLGWGGYSFEPFATSCSLDWATSIVSSKIYNCMVFVLVFALPVVFMAWSSLMVTKKISTQINTLRIPTVACTISSRNNTNVAHVNILAGNNRSQNITAAVQARSQKIILMTLVMFVLFWSPYAIMSMLANFDQPVSVDVSFLPTIMAKGHCAVNPLVYIACFQYYRRPLHEVFGIT